MSKRSAASANPTLTNYAFGIAQDMRSALANFIAPEVEVPAGMGQFKSFSDKDAFQVYETARPMGGKPNRIQFLATDGTFNCKPQALEVTVDDEERRVAGEVDPIRLDESKIRTLISSCMLAREVRVFAKVNAVTAVTNRGQWPDPDVDPIAELDEQILAIVTATGMMPNRLAIGIGAWNTLRNHPKVLARQPGAVVVGLTLPQLSAMLINPAIEIRVGIISKDTVKFGKDKSATNVMGAVAVPFIGSNSPTQFDPSWIKTFVPRYGGVDQVRTYRDEPNLDVHLTEWGEDVQVTGTACAKRLVIT